jgi:hypothetical protein
MTWGEVTARLASATVKPHERRFYDRNSPASLPATGSCPRATPQQCQHFLHLLWTDLSPRLKIAARTHRPGESQWTGKRPLFPRAATGYGCGACNQSSTQPSINGRVASDGVSFFYMSLAQTVTSATARTGRTEIFLCCTGFYTTDGHIWHGFCFLKNSKKACTLNRPTGGSRTASPC